MKQRALQGTHLTLRTDAKILQLHVALHYFLESNPNVRGS